MAKRTAKTCKDIEEKNNYQNKRRTTEPKDDCEQINEYDTSILQKSFDAVAEHLLNEVIINVGKDKYRIMEFEFYKKDKIHCDPFVHGSRVQSFLGNWYFHTSGKSLTSFKGGSYKGLDITFGPTKNVHTFQGISKVDSKISPSKKASDENNGDDGQQGFGGILIRAIENIKTKVYVDGPCLVVDSLLKSAKAKDISTLTAGFNSLLVSDKSNSMYLERYKLDVLKLHSSARVGLSLKCQKENYSLIYLAKKYRYLARPEKSKHKVHIVIALHENNLSVEEISAITKVNLKTVDKYINSYEYGKTKRTPKDFLLQGTTTVDKLCQLLGCCRKLESAAP